MSQSRPSAQNRPGAENRPSTQGQQLPASARAIAAATTDAVVATGVSGGAADVVAFDEAVGRLAGCEPEQVRVVLGVVVRNLLEELHPAGVSGDDLLELIKSCARRSSGWYPGVDLSVLVVVLTGALGVHEPELEPRTFTPLDVARHAPLFIAELLVTGPAARSLPDYFAAAYLEISRSELNELP